MGVVIRQSFKASVVSYLGAAIGALVTIFLYPYFLTPELIGLTRLLLDTAIFFAFFAQLGIPNAITKFYPKFKEYRLNQSVFWYITLFPILSFIIVGGIFILFWDNFIALFTVNSSLFVTYCAAVIPIAFFTMYQNIYEEYSANLYRITVPKFIREILIRICTVGTILLFALWHLGITEYIAMIVMTYFLAALLNMVYVFRISGSHFRTFSLQPIPKTLFKETGSFMAFMFITGIGTNLVARIGTLMIGSLSGLQQTGIYAIAFFIAVIIEIPSRSAIQITSPILAEALKKNDIGKVDDIYKRNTLNQAIIAGFIFVMLWINIDNIFRLMPNGHLFESGKYVVLAIGLTKIIDVTTGLNNQIILYSKYYRYSLLWVIGLGFINILLNLILIPRLGITGAGIATLLSLTIMNIFALYLVHNKLGTQPFTLRSILVFALYMLCFGVNYFIPRIDNLFLDIGSRSLIISALYLFVTLRFKLSKDISETIQKFVNIKEFLKFIKGE